jgi:hypothetical protein
MPEVLAGGKAGVGTAERRGMTIGGSTWCGWPQEPAEFAGLPLRDMGGEEGEAREFRARATGGRESGAVAANSRADDPRAAQPASEVGKEEPRKEGRRGGPELGTRLASFPGSGDHDMRVATREAERAMVWWAVLMLLVALLIFGAACWLMDSRADRAAWFSAHACAGGRCW